MTPGYDILLEGVCVCFGCFRDKSRIECFLSEFDLQIPYGARCYLTVVPNYFICTFKVPIGRNRELLFDMHMTCHHGQGRLSEFMPCTFSSPS